MHAWRRPGLTSGWLVAASIMIWSPNTFADDFESGSLIIPMDIDFQNTGMLRAYGLVYELLRIGIPVQWSIREGKLYGESDFSAVVNDFGTGAPIGEHGYRGGPFVVNASDSVQAIDVVTAWQLQYPETNVHQATEAFSADVARYLVAAPNIAILNDYYTDIPIQCLQAAGIPDSELSLDWGLGSPNILEASELAGSTEISHNDGSLFDEDGDPVYCQLISGHWGIAEANDNPEVVAEVRAYLGHPVHFFAQCQAVNAFENSIHGLFLTSTGFDIGDQPDLVDHLHADSPFAQIDGLFDTVGGSEPSYSLPPGGAYKAGGITMITEAGTPVGVNDVWMTGFLDGACPPDQHECGEIGKVSYLGGHEYDTSTPISLNPQAQGVRMFLNSLFEAPCATAEGQPSLGLAANAPAETTIPAIEFIISYANSDFATVLEAVLVDELPPGTSFVSASSGGIFADGVVTWQLGNIGPGEARDVTVEVEFSEHGTYQNDAVLYYRMGLTERELSSNISETIYAEGHGTTEGGVSADDTGASGLAEGDNGGSGDNGSNGTATMADQLDNDSRGCGCHSSGADYHGGRRGLLLLGGFLLLGVRRRSSLRSRL
jgi:uncharacterized repeat protein (TIGR01451 family)/MYXO-CTERM domain-containing protein